VNDAQYIVTIHNTYCCIFVSRYIVTAPLIYILQTAHISVNRSHSGLGEHEGE